MNPDTLTHEIIKWVTKNDNALLETPKGVKDADATATEDRLADLNEEEIVSFKRGIEDHEKGKVVKSKEL